MIKILFPAFFLMVSSCGMITAKEIHGRQLLHPLMVQTAPPPLSYHGSAAGFDYFSTLFCKYKVPQTEEIMLEQYRRPFVSWRGGGEKQKPGPSINKQGKWTVMLFPAAAPCRSLERRPYGKKQASGPFERGGDSSGGKKQAALLDCLPNSLPAETANHGAEGTY